MNSNFAIIIVFAVISLLAVSESANGRQKRSSQDFYNYYDEMATSACVAMGNVGGLYFAVRRACQKGPSCSQICRSYTIRKQAQIWDSNKLLDTKCVDSFHVYHGRPKLGPVGVNKVGLTIYKYSSCHHTTCGPNYCCCTGPSI